MRGEELERVAIGVQREGSGAGESSERERSWREQLEERSGRREKLDRAARGEQLERSRAGESRKREGSRTEQEDGMSSWSGQS